MKTPVLTPTLPQSGADAKGSLPVNAFFDLLHLPEAEKVTRGLVHTPAEIAQQPDTWAGTYDLFLNNRERIAALFSAAGLSTNSSNAPIVFLVGAGTSDYIGQSLTYLLRKRWGCEVVAVASTDLLTHMEDFILPGRKYLWISFSRSGESPEGVAVLELAQKKYPGIFHLIVSCNATGKMIRESASDPHVLGICLDDAVNDRSLAMTSSFTNMVIFGQCLAHVYRPGSYEPILRSLVEAGKKFLPAAAVCASSIAEGEYTRACFVGSGALRAAARESALKLLELTAGKIVTMSESALGLRHGPMAALDESTLFVFFLAGERRTRQYELDLLEEIGKKRLGKMTVVVGEEGALDERGVDHSVDYTAARHYLAHAPQAAIADEYRPPLDVIFGQLLGLFFSLRCGLQPDRPSPTGAISRVVQEFRIHE